MSLLRRTVSLYTGTSTENDCMLRMDGAAGMSQLSETQNECSRRRASMLRGTVRATPVASESARAHRAPPHGLSTPLPAESCTMIDGGE